MITKEGSTKIVNFMTPEARVLVLGRGHDIYLAKMHYSFENFLNSQAYIRYNEHIVMISKEGFIKIVDFRTHGLLIPVPGLFIVPIENFSLIWRRHHYR